MKAIHHCLSPSRTGEFRVPPEFSPGGGAQCKCDTRNIDHAVNNACTDVYCCHVTDFCSPSQEVQAKMSHNIRTMICQRIHQNGTGPVMAQPHNYQASFDGNFFDYILEELIEQPNNSFNRLCSFVAVTEASLQFWAFLPMGGSAIASSSQPILCSDSTSKSNDITSITNMTRIENTGLVNGSMILEGAISLQCFKRCQWSDLGFCCCDIVFQVSWTHHNGGKCNRTDGLAKSDVKHVKS